MIEKPLSIAIAGLGTVGIGIIKILESNKQLIKNRCGRELKIVAVSARNKRKQRDVDLSKYEWADDPVSLARRKEIDLIVEVIGGADGPAKAMVETAIKHKKHVVTANKAMLAEHGHYLAIAAEENNVTIRFEAAVAGGIPIIKALTEGLSANKIKKVTGVMNGTCNYILTRMEETKKSYESVFSEAKSLGYVEADPNLDVGGIDAAQKLAILSTLAFNSRIDFNNILIEGIDRISLIDIENANSMGYRIKLLGVSQISGNILYQSMQPCLVPRTSPLAQLEGGTNMVIIEADFVGQTAYSGPGAGEGPTASAIVSDIIDIARNNIGPVFGVLATKLSIKSISSETASSRYYIRFSLIDKPGVLAKVSGILGEHQISVDRMRQAHHQGSEAPLLIVTHKTRRNNLNKALIEIEKLDVSLCAPVAIKIEEV